MIHVELRFTELEELTELEKWCSLKEKFGNDASSTKDIHSFGHPTILLTLNILPRQFRLLGADIGILSCCVEPFWCNITSSASGGVEVEGEVGRVVEWKISWLIGSKIGNINPVPGGDKDILAFDVSVRYLAVANITESCKDLECDPFLLNG